MLRALIFDSFYDKHRGVIAFVRLFSGEVKKGDTVYFIATGGKTDVIEVGFFKPDLVSCPMITNGEVGYIVTGLKDLEKVKVGDTISGSPELQYALPGYKEAEPKVFSSIFPVDADDFQVLKEAMSKIKLSDASLTWQTENIPALGFGFRCGFLGLLHMDIIQERLSREFDLALVLTTPSVEYRIVDNNDQEVSIHNPSELPDPSYYKSISEPWVKMEIITPEEYVGKIVELITGRRGIYQGINLLSLGQMQMTARIPLAEMIVDFYDDLKSATKGYATLSYETDAFEDGDLVKVNVLVNSNIVDPLSFITHRSRSLEKGRMVCEKLKELIPRQQFEIAIQAAIGGKVIARETIKPYRKDVTAGMYGGDMSRRKKLLEKQKKGKKRMKMIGNVEIPQTAFLNVLKK